MNKLDTKIVVCLEGGKPSSVMIDGVRISNVTSVKYDGDGTLTLTLAGDVSFEPIGQNVAVEAETYPCGGSAKTVCDKIRKNTRTIARIY